MNDPMIMNSNFLIPTGLNYKALYNPWRDKDNDDDDDDDDNNNWILTILITNYCVWVEFSQMRGRLIIKNNSVTWWYHIPLLQGYQGNEAVNQLR